ncbi:DUF982 domain-containing protein [Martelella sp. FLE1502]|mgnify:CR=1 FL=1
MGHFARWVAPVYLGFGEDGPLAVKGPSQARNLLAENWPHRRGRHYHAAVNCCERAVAQPGWLEMSREAFIAAALEAGLFSGHSGHARSFVPGITGSGPRHRPML